MAEVSSSRIPQMDQASLDHRGSTGNVAKLVGKNLVDLELVGSKVAAVDLVCEKVRSGKGRLKRQKDEKARLIKPETETEDCPTGSQDLSALVLSRSYSTDRNFRCRCAMEEENGLKSGRSSMANLRC